MYTLHYEFEGCSMHINFANLNDAFVCTRALDSLKEDGSVTKIHVSNADDPDSFYMVPPMKYLLKEV